ncbi:MAG: hypothetical protein RIB58_04635 [Phycisphaerales bacterium]
MLGVIAWLGGTGRVDRDRLEAVRTIFADTVAEQAAREALEAEQAESEAESPDANAGMTPVASNALVDADADSDAVELQRLARMRDDITNMELALAEKIEAFEEEREAFQAMRDDFERTREAIAAQEGDEQFQKSLKTYETISSEAARDMLATLINGGEMEQVIGYLSAMKSRTRAGIVSAFEEDDPKLAAELLERLRNFGILAETD